MNAQFLRPKLRSWFETYTNDFFSADPVVQENMNLTPPELVRNPG